MAKSCEMCGKKPMSGHRISHAHNLSKRRFEPNLRAVRARVGPSSNRRIRVCTRCIRSGAVQKAS